MSIPSYREIWVEDFEYYQPDGERPSPHCWAGLELLSGRRDRLWITPGVTPPPFAVTPDVLAIAFQAQAEAGSRLALGWPVPQYLDLHIEYRVLTNGTPRPGGDGLLAACLAHRIPTGDAAEKDAGQALAMRPVVPVEDRAALLDYCARDVDKLAALARAMWPDLDLPRAILRGEYQIAAAGMGSPRLADRPGHARPLSRPLG